MSKRSLSPALLPASKHLKTDSTSLQYTAVQTSAAFTRFLYDEVILNIFSYLNFLDLCSAQRTNRDWCRLGGDNSLWKHLYLAEFSRPRLRGGRGFIGRSDGRLIKPLPGRAASSAVQELKDWKRMFAISNNWRKGRCSVERITRSVVADSLPTAVSTSDVVAVPEQSHVILVGDLIIAASSTASSSPHVSVRGPTGDEYTLVCKPTHPSSSCYITALSQDQSPPSHDHHLRLAVFLSTGEFIVYLFDHGNPSSGRLQTKYTPPYRSERVFPILHAAYHHPLLVTLSRSFRLSLYDLSSEPVFHTQTLSSFTSYPPSSLVLSAPTSTTYKLVLAYAIPVYPQHFSVGATELIISSTAIESPMSVISTRSSRSVDIPQGWIDETKLQAMREQWNRKVSHVAACQTDGKWVVLASQDPSFPSWTSSPSSPSSSSLSTTPSHSSIPSSPSLSYVSSQLHSTPTLQLYRLSLPSLSNSSSSLTPPNAKLTFVRNLRGPSEPVSALNIADGRCVSLGVMGSIWVWDLENLGQDAEGTEIAESTLLANDSSSGAMINGAIAFDDRRIISIGEKSSLAIRRFDI